MKASLPYMAIVLSICFFLCSNSLQARIPSSFFISGLNNSHFIHTLQYDNRSVCIKNIPITASGNYSCELAWFPALVPFMHQQIV